MKNIHIFRFFHQVYDVDVVKLHATVHAQDVCCGLICLLRPRLRPFLIGVGILHAGVAAGNFVTS